MSDKKEQIVWDLDNSTFHVREKDERYDNVKLDPSYTLYTQAQELLPTIPPAAIISAYEIIQKAIQTDPGYAWSWHCNIAMPMYDEGVDHFTANRGAARVMQILFKTDTSQFKEYKDIELKYK